MSTTVPEQFRDIVVAEKKKGNIVFLTFDGASGANLNDFVKQPAEGILYDLNRLPEVVMTFIDDKKWVNDFAVGLVITKLKDMLEEHAVSMTKLVSAVEASVSAIADNYSDGGDSDDMISLLSGLLEEVGSKENVNDLIAY